MRVQPETWSTSIRHYRSRLCLLYLLWSLSPSYSSRPAITPSEVDLTAGPPVCTAPSPLLSSAAGTSEGTDGSQQAASGRTGRLTRPVDQQSQTVPVTAPFDPTLADLSQRENPASASSSSSTYMPVKGSTSRDVNTSSGWAVTPSLSEKPPAVSAVVKPDMATSEGPRTPLQHSDNAALDAAFDEASAATCASSPEPSASPATPSSSLRPRLTPLHVTLLYLHLLYAVRLTLHTVRNSITTALIANPLPPCEMLSFSSLSAPCFKPSSPSRLSSSASAGYLPPSRPPSSCLPPHLLPRLSQFLRTASQPTTFSQPSSRLSRRTS
ncbi:hypothetical protein AAT19DRAFT_10172 [Rhodotorula toruloides]|uniref:Proteophosphoglycan ppg4 n=1 Tax=Rhodotorula toruloides TaxID=5286 RepID=A0A2S9ZZZ0_RHOTO|nr:hypothetical protein AAT19DRAFT_10172 [Rhodotorula toruloides]